MYKVYNSALNKFMTGNGKNIWSDTGKVWTKKNFVGSALTLRAEDNHNVANSIIDENLKVVDIMTNITYPITYAISDKKWETFSKVKIEWDSPDIEIAIQNDQLHSDSIYYNGKYIGCIARDKIRTLIEFGFKGCMSNLFGVNTSKVGCIHMSYSSFNFNENELKSWIKDNIHHILAVIEIRSK